MKAWPDGIVDHRMFAPEVRLFSEGAVCLLKLRMGPLVWGEEENLTKVFRSH